MGGTIAVIGGGFGGLASAALLARAGFQVDLYEKNDQTGGRARYWDAQGWRFDMGPSWYLMPEVFERWFSLMGRKITDYYELKKLPVSYRVFFEDEGQVDLDSDADRSRQVFESFESGGAARLDAYLADAGFKYRVALDEFLYRDYRHVSGFMNRRLLVDGTRIGVLGSLDRLVRRHFKSLKARQILEYAMVFLGTDPVKAPAMYSLMSHVDLRQGVYYPSGGMAAVASAMEKIAREEGVRIHLSSEVEKIETSGGRVKGVRVGGKSIEADMVLANADYHHAEMDLLEPSSRSHTEKWWKKRTVAPSMFILYLGVDKVLPQLTHHNLYFSRQWEKHFDQIFKNPAWPENPCFYLSVISRTDNDAAPPGCENLFVLVPVAPGLKADKMDMEAYADGIIAHVENCTGTRFADHIKVRRMYGPADFSEDYHAYQGTALGLSHTLGQTAIFRPAMRSPKVEGLFFAGQYTHPGVGVPMVLIASEIVTGIMKEKSVKPQKESLPVSSS